MCWVYPREIPPRHPHVPLESSNKWKIKEATAATARDVRDRRPLRPPPGGLGRSSFGQVKAAGDVGSWTGDFGGFWGKAKRSEIYREFGGNMQEIFRESMAWNSHIVAGCCRVYVPTCRCCFMLFQWLPSSAIKLGSSELTEHGDSDLRSGQLQPHRNISANLATWKSVKDGWWYWEDRGSNRKSPNVSGG